MILNDYQKAVARTMNKNDYALANYSMGLAGEAGEVVDILKKHLFHGHELDTLEVVKELGDVMWYVSAIANELQIDLDMVARLNVEKLEKRYPKGFSKADSINRKE